MSTTTHLIAWLACSSHEAARLRHPEVDVDHLLLGLIAEGGAAAALLGMHGVTLAGARQAIQELADTDLAALGVDAPTIRATAPPSALAAQAFSELGEIPISARAQQLVGARQASFNTSLSTLQALLDADTDAPMRLLAHLGVDPESLHAELTARARRRPRGQDGTSRRDSAVVERDLLPDGPAAALCLTRFISAPSARVRAVLADPSLLHDWAVLPEEVRATHPDGIISRHDSRTGRRHLDLRWCRVEPAPDSLVWAKTLLNGPNRGQAFAYDRFDLRPAPGGCALTLTRAYRIWRLSGRLLHPVTRRLTRIGMVNAFGAIARTVAASL
ncbi:Clp amino terminal domain-containing protein, pathogenicity island component [Actinomyces ruminicola]|uniref:Clp amino terminal domain-containing protein, pathogenicity island component n=1 Tax=Actinomyces ruminicola TaxID=332524 RepID=A0A1H0CA74_9ACTO|nr:SRPBCC family protein [Actinomyces ruminicola]SDN54824.1 Clp amino terminal domain-containing protein, pathogenicity island component [Actinomyces ruminicola]